MYRNNLLMYFIIRPCLTHVSRPTCRDLFSELAKYHCEASLLLAHRDGSLKKTDVQTNAQEEKVREVSHLIQFLRNALNSELTILTAGHTGDCECDMATEIVHGLKAR